MTEMLLYELKYRNKRIFLQILPFGVISLVFSIVYSLLEKGILGNHQIYPSTGNPYNFQVILPVMVSMVMGLMIGIFEVFYLNKWFQKWSFSKKIIIKTTIYLLIAMSTILLVVIIKNAFELGVSPVNNQIWNIVAIFLFDFAFWSSIIYFTLAIVFCLFYLEVSDNIGQSVLLNFFTGKYHQPIEEERVYMFLDMKSSTTTAEHLGHGRYFKLLKEYFVDLSEPIIQYGGEIYQYVGDEIIITWKLKKGFADNSLNCFFAMKNALKSQAKKYLSEYGVIPTFKAGIHFGKVTSGEIGVIKKDIAFSGDVLNTTARIQGLCNTYNVALLASEKFINALESDEAFILKSLGKAALRGKKEKINLFTIEKKLSTIKPR